ncbi:DUF2252 family protein, partial [Rhodoblastus sp.]|uniref:DUF2252 family protein n=1 Tax=Rhodoblastus sp. TaxID=1962975 RepID=UPI003F9ACC76
MTCLTVAARQSSLCRDRQIGNPVRRNASIQIVALQPKDRQAVLRKRITKATSHASSELVFPKLVETASEQPRIRDAPPTIFHPDRATAAGNLALIRETLPKYRETLADDRRILLDRYHLVDAAVKVVGIGSVGTLCMVLLMMSDAGHRKRRLFPILLRGLSTVEDLRFSALLRQIERSRGNGTIERNAGGERRCRQACKTHSFREPG